ncbi:hypothetical protein [Kangiella koreensis]|uniref:Biopolymer transport protein ExbD/TolR n=1 Tax=Kangiella koreensis (strain DSM 16069 / JCM 12317 / KCTC 12182 / SW-125) TaxID=523791 RepID=C7RBL2_KANKD|nr:hypothetical protein [Kangiella koreensis]ACV26654.1 hypothetical protein Kkor_1235 [Kangiella koreensis DSM 16069]
MKKLLLIIIAIFFLVGCSESYESNGLFIEVAQEGCFVNKEKVDDIEAFLLDVSNPEAVEIYLHAETGVSAAKVLHVLDLAKELGFKEISVFTPIIQ